VGKGFILIAPALCDLQRSLCIIGSVMSLFLFFPNLVSGMYECPRPCVTACGSIVESCHCYCEELLCSLKLPSGDPRRDGHLLTVIEFFLNLTIGIGPSHRDRYPGWTFAQSLRTSCPNWAIPQDRRARARSIRCLGNILHWQVLDPPAGLNHDSKRTMRAPRTLTRTR
jgi:hypothetical protein